MITIGEVKSHLIGMGHSGTLNRVRNFEQMCFRAANTMLTKVKPLEIMYVAELPQAVHDQIYDYPVQDYFGSVIDVYPADNRTSMDDASRIYAETFDRTKGNGIGLDRISIESKQGVKFLRIDWPVQAPIVVNTMSSLTANGAWSAVGSATNLRLDTLRKISGAASIEFDLVTTGDGIKNTTMTAVDLSAVDSDGVFFAWVYFPSVTNLTSITLRWGNDLTLSYWQSAAATTCFDGSAFGTGWNLVSFPWTSATETGTVDDTEIDSLEFTVAATGAIAGIRVDNIVVSLGRYFNLKAYSKYLFQDGNGTWLSQPNVGEDDNVVMCDTDSVQIFLLELLIAMAQQTEGGDSSFDISFAKTQLHGDPSSPSIEGRLGLYRMYKSDQPDQRKKITAKWYGDVFRRGRGW